MHDGSIDADDEIGRAADDLLDHVQAAPFAARLLRHAHHVPGAVSDEGLGVGAQAGNYRCPHLARRRRPAVLVQYLEDVALAYEQHLALRRLVRGKAEITAAELVRYWDPKSVLDQFPLVGIERLAGRAYHAQLG